MTLPAMPLPALPPLLVGSYTATGGGTATGISFVESGAASTVAVLDDPSFLAVSGDRVYAVSETTEGSISAFRRNGTALGHLWDAPSGGDSPCHVRVDASGALIVTNYGSGTVTAVSLAEAESLAASVLASDGVVGAGIHGSGDSIVVPASAIFTLALPHATGPVDDRQEAPHAHQSIETPDGTLLVADLGGDTVHEFRVGPAATGGAAELSIEPVRAHHVGAGVGPRHMAWYDGDLFVAGELDGYVHRLRRDASGSFRVIASAATFDGDAGDSLLSHIEVDEAALVFVAVRGRDLIVTLSAADGGLSVVGSGSCGGVWPRHFALVPGYLLVANQMSDAIAVLPVGDDGVVGEPAGQIAVGSPACIVPL